MILRTILRQPRSLALSGFSTPIASALVAVECRRTLDRVRLREALAADEAGVLDANLRSALLAFQMIPLGTHVLERAAGPLSLPLGTLDAIHLSTALLYRERAGLDSMIFATHDRELAAAARWHHFDVLGD